MARRQASTSSSEVVRFLFAEADRKGIGAEELADRIHVDSVTMRRLRHRKDPRILRVEQLAKVLGYRLALEPDGP